MRGWGGLSVVCGFSGTTDSCQVVIIFPSISSLTPFDYFKCSLWRISTLSLLASEPTSMEGDCIWMIAVDDSCVILGLSTGWICSASLRDANSRPSITITWSFNSLQQMRRLKQPSGWSILYICGTQISREWDAHSFVHFLLTFNSYFFVRLFFQSNLVRRNFFHSDGISADRRD